jgi:hypothetical protein
MFQCHWCAAVTEWRGAGAIKTAAGDDGVGEDRAGWGATEARRSTEAEARPALRRVEQEADESDAERRRAAVARARVGSFGDPGTAGYVRGVATVIEEQVVHTPSSEYHHGDASPAISLTDSSILSYSSGGGGGQRPRRASPAPLARRTRARGLGRRAV